MLMVPALLMALVAVPTKLLNPFVLQMPPALLLNVAEPTLRLPVIVPVLVIVLAPLNTATAWLLLVLEKRLAAIVPLFVSVAVCMLWLFICTTALLFDPRAVIVPELLIETSPLAPVPETIPEPPATVIVPWFVTLTLPVCAVAFTPTMGAVIEDAASKWAVTSPPTGVGLLSRVPRLKRKMPAPEAAWMVALLEKTTLPWIFAVLLPPLYPAEI